MPHSHLPAQLLCIAGTITLIETSKLNENLRIFYLFFSSLGTDRSSIFVTLCILVQQLRLEKKIDVCTVVRKLRSQRPQFLNTFVSFTNEHLF